jgi:hypothetical protein
VLRVVTGNKRAPVQIKDNPAQIFSEDFILASADFLNVQYDGLRFGPPRARVAIGIRVDESFRERVICAERSNRTRVDAATGPFTDKLPLKCPTFAPDQQERDQKNGNAAMHLTRHKISDCEPCKACYAAIGWMANTQKVDRRMARGSLHRVVRCLVCEAHRAKATTNNVTATITVRAAPKTKSGAAK